MKPSSYSSLPALALLLGTLTLAGCGGAASFSTSATKGTTPTAPQLVAGPAVNGSVFGGHAPIVGSHVYLLQPGTSGYGSIATSILGNNGASTAGGYTISSGSGDPNIPPGWKYVTTDSSGGFSLSGAYNCAAGQPVYIYSYGGNATGGTATNTAIVELAILGNCPSIGQTNFGTGSSDYVNFVYNNEVSTVAAAYVFQPFTVQAAASGASSAIYVGTSGSPQALLGIENAAATAAQLYAIQGNGGQSSTLIGEDHIANYRTQGVSEVGGVYVSTPNTGNGVVPQATIDTLANIIAACVDNTGATATPCATLFTNATETGDSAGVQPTDIARAMMNIARYPAGNYSTANTPTNFVKNIFAIPTSTVPYTPNLGTSQPNDFTIAINYPYNAVGGGASGYNTSNPDVEKAESIEVDNLGQIWITAQGSQSATTPEPSADRWSPLGVYNATNAESYNYGYVSIDGGNNAWTGNASSTTGIFYAGANGAFSTIYGSGYTDAYAMIADQTGDAFFFAMGTGTSTNYGMWEYAPGGTLVAGSPFNISSGTTTNSETLTITNATVASATSHGTTTYTYTFTATNPGSPAGSPTIVAGNTLSLTLTNQAGGANWTKLKGNQTVATTPAPTGTQFTVTTTTNENISGDGEGTASYSYTTTGTGAIPAGDNVAHGAIDPDGHLWITTESGNTIARISPTGVTDFTPIVTSTRPEFAAVDGSNNAWIPIQNPTGVVYKVSDTGTAVEYYSGTGTNTATAIYTGANFLYPFGSAVDGNGNVWITNRCGPTSGTTNYNICTVNAKGVETLTGAYSTLVEINGSNSLAISPPANYIPEAQYGTAAFGRVMSDPLNIAIDPSGNLWITNYAGNVAGGGQVVEIIGTAAPVVTPLSVAAGDNVLGTKP